MTVVFVRDLAKLACGLFLHEFDGGANHVELIFFERWPGHRIRDDAVLVRWVGADLRGLGAMIPASTSSFSNASPDSMPGPFGILTMGQFVR